MKIGQYTKRNNISKDTVRHYVDMGLLFPIKDGAHYEFDEKSEQDLRDILSLKEMGFTLNEIKKILSFKRIGKLTHYQTADYYKQFFQNKLRDISEEIAHLKQTEGKLKTKIKALSDYKTDQVFKMGIDLKALPYMVCPHCNEPLSLENGSIESNQLLNGTLSCPCGNSYPIKDGIFYGKKQSDEPFHMEDEFFVDYILDTPSEFIDLLYKGIVWLDKNLDFESFKNKVAIDLGVGVGFFLRHIYDRLPDSTIYFAIDYDIKRLQVLKRLLERANSKKKIIYICSDFTEIPISHGTVDLIVDIAGSSNYAFNNKPPFLLNKIRNLFKESAELVGNYFIYDKFSKESIIKQEHRDLFKEYFIKSQLHTLNFINESESRTDSISDGGKFETFISSGEQVHMYYNYAKRKL